MARARKKKEDNGANLGFEAKTFLAACKRHGTMVTPECSDVVLGLTCLANLPH